MFVIIDNPTSFADAFAESLEKAVRHREPVGVGSLFGDDSAPSAVVPDSYRRKAAHEMTQNEYLTSIGHVDRPAGQADRYGNNHAPDPRARHEGAVHAALALGQSVPAHVLADYPHLKGVAGIKQIGVKQVGQVKAPKPSKSTRITVTHTGPMSSLSLFDELEHPRGQSGGTFNPETGKIIKPGAVRPET